MKEENSTWDDIIEDWILVYRKQVPKESKEKLFKSLYFYLKLKYANNKAVQEEYDGIIRRVKKRMKRKGINLRSKK